MTFGGVEIINAPRTEAYAHGAGLGWFYGCDDCPNLGMGLGDGQYGSPIADNADWVDPDNPDTWRFYGLYPLSITGIEDSTVMASAVEALGDGGIVTIPRVATRTVVVAGMLIASDDNANDTGMNWLRAALRGSPCGPQTVGCTGDDVCFMLGCPQVCGDSDGEEELCVDQYMVHMHQVTTIEGPKVTAKHAMSDGGSVWEIEFTMVAAKPWICSEGQPVIHAGSLPGDPNPFKPIYNVATRSCAEPIIPTFTDPTCPPLPKPYAYPYVPLNCFQLPTNWDRYSMRIPAAQIPRWSQAVPVINIQAGSAKAMKFVRVRFYEDPLNWFDPSALDECGFCSEFLVQYIPANWTITIDGMTETIMMANGSLTDNIPDTLYNAANSVTSTDDTGFTWPSLTCGAGYVMTFDVPHGDHPPANVDVTIYHRSA
jgi:hypothetical protein